MCQMAAFAATFPPSQGHRPHTAGTASLIFTLLRFFQWMAVEPRCSKQPSPAECPNAGIKRQELRRLSLNSSTVVLCFIDYYHGSPHHRLRTLLGRRDGLCAPNADGCGPEALSAERQQRRKQPERRLELELEHQHD
ncbi:hypothetical protein BV25DRAFT_599282 [Artomyces pyxidatus]|uniref:Uncharacterized protein n=1 Tax=Artomyces pyxidatus TaxID=48021 RepID=A0ACB8T1J0_9AGAM|nr:hypothetical protein BV25DRAFT_599282 [Artomyces pyxidatus]